MTKTKTDSKAKRVRTVKKQAPVKSVGVVAGKLSLASAEQANSGLGARKTRGKKETLSRVAKEAATQRALAFRATRLGHSKESAEDYTELVLDLIQSMGEARIVSIAAHLGVSHVTALRTVARLVEEGYLSTSRHQPVELTTKGRKVAKASKERHEVVRACLLKLGASEHDAAVDAEGIEHHVSASTLRAMKEFLGR